MIVLPSINTMYSSDINLIICTDQSEAEQVLRTLKKIPDLWYALDLLYDLTDPVGMSAFFKVVQKYPFFRVVGVIDRKSFRNNKKLRLIAEISAVWEAEEEREAENKKKGEQET